MPRFVILEHDHPHRHWDLMLETGGSLRTWRLESPPGMEAGDFSATALGDHRLAYLDYEGPVSGGRGTVRRWDSGVYVEEVLSAGVALTLKGRRLHGRGILRRLEGERWVFEWGGQDDHGVAVPENA